MNVMDKVLLYLKGPPRSGRQGAARLGPVFPSLVWLSADATIRPETIISAAVEV